jgi:hypothetical protein
MDKNGNDYNLSRVSLDNFGVPSILIAPVDNKKKSTN